MLGSRYGPKGLCRSTFSLVEWAKRPEVHKAWSELKQEHHLESDPFAAEEGMFAALQFSLTMSWSWATRYVTTLQCLLFSKSFEGSSCGTPSPTMAVGPMC